MTSIINGPTLGTAGVGKFYEGVDLGGRAACTALNIAGWIPGPSIVSGAVRTLAGLRILSGRSRSKKRLGTTWIVRGIAEMCCLGFVLAPVDIGCTAARIAMS
jgi:hypothetical protein